MHLLFDRGCHFHCLLYRVTLSLVNSIRYGLEVATTPAPCYNPLMNTNFERLTLERNHLINVSEAAAPSSFPPHWHQELEIIAPLQNAYHLEINGVWHALERDDIALVLPGDIHAIASREGRPSLVLQFPPALLTVLYDFRHYWSLFKQQPITRADLGAARLLMETLMEIQAIYHSDHIFKGALIYSKLLEFFTILGQDLLVNSRAVAGSASLQAHTSKIAEACSYIAEHCHEVITLEDIASKIGYSKFYFSRLFCVCTNMSLPRFVTQARLRRAEDLLAEKDLPVIDVALQSGFGSISTFNRLFKQYKGISPSDFRRLYDGRPRDSVR